MIRIPRIGLLFLLVATSACPESPGMREDERVEIEANDLQQAFLADEREARERFDDRHLVIYGEVVRAFPRFRGTTMEGEVEMPAYVELWTELDTLPTDIKYVTVEGDFDVPDTLEPWVIDPRIRVGDSLRVSCPDAQIRWSDPGLYVSDCRIAD